MKRHVLIASLILAFAPLASLAGGDPWLHVNVDDRGSGGETVRVNIPLSLVEAVLPAIEGDELRHGHLDWDLDTIEGVDIRQILEALHDAPDADYVTVKGEDESVRVAKEDGFLLVVVDENEGDHVRVRLPLGVVDALLGSDDDELDLLAALKVLADYDGGDLVTVESEDESVRIWIDTSHTSK